MDELVALLQAQGEEGEGLSSRELAEATGRSLSWVIQRLREVKQQGRLRVARKRNIRIDGAPCLVPAYSLRSEE
jgi:DNA-binding Lrp family transcriptional regulator